MTDLENMSAFVRVLLAVDVDSKLSGILRNSIFSSSYLELSNCDTCLTWACSKGLRAGNASTDLAIRRSVGAAAHGCLLTWLRENRHTLEIEVLHPKTLAVSSVLAS